MSISIMPTSFVLGFDLGSSSCKVTALDLAGHYLGTQSQEYPTLMPQSGWAEQEPAHWLPALSMACKRLLTSCHLDGKLAAGVSITSASHIGVLLDQHDKVLRPAILWNDQRSHVESADLAATMGEQILDKTGNWPSPTWTLPHFLWIAKHEPKIWQQVRTILLSKDYISYLLTGNKMTDPAGSVSALLFDQHNNDWDQSLCDLVGITREMLPDIAPIGARIGSLTADMAALLGLSTNTIVFNGTLDSTAETFSAGVRREGECVIRLASAGGIHCITKDFKAHPKLISYPYLVEPYWLSQAGTNTCAFAISWVEKLLSQQDKADFHAWTTLAAKSPAGANGIMFHPYLNGERCPYWDSRLRASFIGLSLNHDRSDIARASYEGTAYSLKDALTVIDEQGFKLEKVKLIGGGAKSQIWSEIVCNVLGYQVQTVPNADSSTGGALICLFGLGEFAHFADISEPQSGQTIIPNGELNAFYQDSFKHYQFIQRNVANIYSTPLKS